jgi:hypothetical protein
LPNNILQTFNNIIQLSNNNLQLSNNISQTSDIILHNNICKYCKKILSHRNSRWRHEKSCKEKKKLIINNNKIQLLEEKNKQLEEMINKLALEIKNKNLHQTNNGTINEIGTINNIQIVSLGREDLSKLSIKEQKNILKFGSSSLKKIIADVNFNPKIPEQQNIKLTNLAKKTCKQYDEQSKNFIEVPKDRLICSLINIRTGDLIEIHEEFKEDGNRCHDSVNYIINVVNNYQDNSDNKDFEKKYLELKKEIELLIYNKTKELNNKK